MAEQDSISLSTSLSSSLSTAEADASTSDSVSLSTQVEAEQSTFASNSQAAAVWASESLIASLSTQESTSASLSVMLDRAVSISNSESVSLSNSLSVSNSVLVSTSISKATEVNVTAGGNWEFQNYINGLKHNGKSTTKTLISFVETYISAMKPRMPNPPKELARQQTHLWNGLRAFIDRADDEESFDEGMKVMVAFFREHNQGVFHEHYVFRGMPHMGLGAHELSDFQALVNLFKLLAGTNRRADAVRQVDMQRSFGRTYSDHQRTRMINWLSK